MHIAIIIGPFLPMPPVLGGAVEKVHLALAGAYRAAGHEVTIISRRYGDFPYDEVIDGLRHLRIPSSENTSSLAANLIRDFRYAVRAAFALPPADVTITNSFFLPAVLPHRKAGKIYVQVGRYPKHQMFLYFRADRLQAVSQAVAEAIAWQTPWLAHKVKVIGYAISDPFFRPSPPGIRGKTILFVGRLTREKGVELLIRAFLALHRDQTSGNFDGWKLRIVGPHEVSQGGDGTEHLSDLTALARPLGCRCEIAGPIFDRDELIREYQASSIFVYPSLAQFGEALPVAPLEAMAAGCAVIVSSLRCFDDYIVDGVTGLKFDHKSPQPEVTLADQIRRLVTDQDLAARVAEGGRRAAREFRTEAIAARMLADFATLLAAPASR